MLGMLKIPIDCLLIDFEDLSKVGRYNWSETTDVGTGLTYLHGNVNGVTLFLHRFVLDVYSPRILIDHKNRNGLDNRKENLRICNHSQNAANSKRRCDNTSGYKGVCFDISVHKFEARITVKGKAKFLGHFRTPEDAARKYNQAAKMYFGDFALLNEDV